MALKSINISGNFDWCPFEEHKNYLICFNSHNLLYSNNNNLNNYIYLLDINLNNDIRNLEIVSKLNFEEALNRESEGGKNSNGNEYITCFEWINSSNFVETENEDELSKGIIVGGLTNGDIVLLNAQNLFEGNNKNYENFILSKVNVHENSVNCLEFNRHKNHLIATGGNDGQLFITDIENIYSPTSYDPYLDKNNLQKITCLNWNKKVSHILATSSNNGNTIIWDLKIKKSAVSFRDPHNRTKTSSLCWLANQPTQILVSYDDDKNPCLQLWDLRNSNYPIKEIIGHSKGINNICFSSIDTNLLLSSGKDITKCWYLNNNNFDIFNEVNNSANNIYSKWSPFIPDMFASVTNMDTIQINSINNGNKMTSKYIPNFYKKDAGICFGFGGKICCFDNNSIDVMSAVLPDHSSSSNLSAQSYVNKNIPNSNEDNDGTAINSKGKNNLLENKYVIKCHIYPTEMELIEEADKFEKYITSGNYNEFCACKIAKSEDDHEKLTWKVLQLLCTSQRSDIVKQLGYDMNEILQKIKESIGKQPGFIFKTLVEEKNNDNLANNNMASTSNLGADNNDSRNAMIGSMNMNGMDMIGMNNNDPTLSSSPLGDNQQNFNNESFDVDPEKFFRELGEKTENEKLKETTMGIENRNNSEKVRDKERVDDEDSDETKVKEMNDEFSNEKRASINSNMSNVNNWSSGIESIIKECVLVGNIETAVELCLHKNRMADALLLSSFGGEQLWYKTKTIYINKQNDNFLRNINYILDDKLDHLVKKIDLSSWGEALSILCTYAINNSNFNALCETLAKRLQNEKFDIRAASICYLCACNFSETVEIWNNMPSTKTSLLNVLQDLVEKMTVLKMVIKYDQYNPIMNQKINQYAELLANSGRVKAAMTFLCLIQDDHSMDSLILRDRIFNSATHILSQQVKPPICPFQVVHVKPSGIMHQTQQQYHQGQPYKSTGILMGSNVISSNQSNLGSSKNLGGPAMSSPMSMQKQQKHPHQPLQSLQPHLQQKHVPPPPPSTHLGYGQMIPPNKFNAPVVSGSSINISSSFSATTNKNFPPSNPNTAKTLIGTMPPSYMSTASIPSLTAPVGAFSPSYGSVPNFSNLNTTQNIMKSEQDKQQQLTPMFTTQSYANINNKAVPNANVISPPNVTSHVTPPMNTNHINNRSNFSSNQNIATSNPLNRGTTVPSSANLMQTNNMIHPPDQFVKREECIDQSMYGVVNAPSMPSMSNLQTKNFPGSFQDGISSVGFSPQSVNPPASGANTTSPIAGALTVTPGMPVPWPIPTTTQQLGSTTQSTANENKKIQTATKEQNGVLMSRGNIENIKKTISTLLNAYTAQESIKKKAEDVSVKVHDLFEKLDNGAFNEQINENIINLVNCLNANDFKTTNRIIVDLSRNLWDGSNKAWIMGLKCIIPK
ncbi:protein transport protein SEC31, putative [Plasmodium malariae]|uniref:Protein transport protein SEC31, putative n=2 Tax=Plasmodium malariae TaxID=5858 RepID=A0A1D3JJ25_PLAMA|nr:protein transport protein SEC31, putative [Plasmodium malariae]SBT86487.1 protein transport protein SEC31, putative [Plasmodium malariae]